MGSGGALAHNLLRPTALNVMMMMMIMMMIMMTMTMMVKVF